MFSLVNIIIKTCFIPKQWDVYVQDALECVVLTILKEHWQAYNTVIGASATIENVSARAKVYEGDIWMCQDEDSSKKPDPDKYVSMNVVWSWRSPLCDWIYGDVCQFNCEFIIVK